jgi:hypothetical protein
MRVLVWFALLSAACSQSPEQQASAGEPGEPAPAPAPAPTEPSQPPAEPAPAAPSAVHEDSAAHPTTAARPSAERSTREAQAPAAQPAAAAAAAPARPAPTAAVAPPSAPAQPCGETGQPFCPLQGFMQQKLQDAVDAGNLALAAQNLARVRAFVPDPSWNDGGSGWSSLVDAALAAASHNDADATRNACKSCHKTWRAKYKASFRTRPLPP